MIDLRSLAAALGGDVVGRAVLAPGPGHSPRDRSLSVTPSPTAEHGFIVFSHAGDHFADCRNHVRDRLALPTTSRAAAVIRPARTPDTNTAAALRIWREATDPRGTLAERYLGEHRGLALPAELCGRVVRFHAHCPWGKERGPCMVTAFRSIADDSLVAIQRALLSDDGTKLDRKTLGPCAGAAIKITADEDVETGLHIGEGFETCLTAHSLGLRPVWALGAVAAIADFPVLAGIEALTVLGETDKKGSNAAAATACATRWIAAGREIFLFKPPGGDVNDMVKP